MTQRLWPRDAKWIPIVLTLVFLLALAIRIVVVKETGRAPGSDALQYHTIAVNLLAGDGFSFIPGEPTSMRPPAYPLFLALIYTILGTDYHHALYVQALLSALLVFPLFYLGQRLTKSALVALTACVFFAFHTSFEIVGRLYSENILIPLALLFVISGFRLFRHHQANYSQAVLCGSVAGIMGLTKPEFSLLGLCFLFVALLFPVLRRRWKELLVIALLPVLMAAGWQLRNSMAVDHGQESFAHQALINSWYPAINGSWWWNVTDMEVLERERAESWAYVEKHPYEEQLRQLKQALRAEPFSIIKLITSRVLILWASPPVGSSAVASHWHDGKWALLVLQYCFVGAALLMLLSGCRDEALASMLALFLYMTVVYGVVHSIRRYGYPYVPELCLLASWGFYYAWGQWRRLRRYVLQPGADKA